MTDSTHQQQETDPNLSSRKKFAVIREFFGPIIIGVSIVLVGFMISAVLVLSSLFLGYRVLPKLNLYNGQNPAASVPVEFSVPESSYTLGDTNAPVSIIEFADFQCPFCKEFHETVFPQIKQEYIDTHKAKFTYIDFAFLGDESVTAAEAARCAGKQNRFWEYHDALFENQKGENEGTFNGEKLSSLARSLNLNIDEFSQCTKERKESTHISETTQLGKDVKVTGTPGVFINGVELVGLQDYHDYASAIDKALKSK